MLFLGEYLEKIIPLVVKFCNVDDDELREYCIQAFESFVRRQVFKISIFQHTTITQRPNECILQ